MAAFSIALSGLTSASADLDVTANNISNADTIGFKESRAEFADVFASGAADLNTSVIGEGVRLASTAQQFTQGDVATSSSNLDLAISGDGFFTLADANGTVYSRNGQFTQDSAGNVVSVTGQALQVYPPLATGGFNTGTLTDLNLQTAQSAPLATTTGTVILNLPAGAAVPSGAIIPVGSGTPPSTAPADGFNPNDSATYNQSTSTTVYDSLGTAYPATMYFTAVAPSATVPANTWSVHMTVNGQPATPTPLPTLTFNASGQFLTSNAPTNAANGTSPLNGNLAFNYPLTAPNTPDGGNPMALSINFSNTTQYGSAFGVTAITQNGYATGQLSTVAINTAGIVSAVYTNGRSTQLGQLAMANFPNPQGLKQLGNTNYSETFSSGDVVQGTASSASFGSIQSGALESSNVDLTTELVNMITAQRAFDSNAQVITTANQESQTVIQITH
jgi:flagellar hook protein FlgE